MTTVINNPGNNDTPNIVQPVVQASAVGPIVAIVIAGAFIALFFIYALPAIRGVQDTKAGGINVEVKMPTPTPTTPSPAPASSQGTN